MNKYFVTIFFWVACNAGTIDSTGNIPATAADSAVVATFKHAVPIPTQQGIFGNMEDYSRIYFYKGVYFLERKTVSFYNNASSSDTAVGYIAFKYGDNTGYSTDASAKQKLSVDSVLKKTFIPSIPSIFSKVIDSTRFLKAENISGDDSKEFYAQILKRDLSYYDSATLYFKILPAKVHDSSPFKEYMIMKGNKMITKAVLKYNDNEQEHIGGIYNSGRNLVFELLIDTQLLDNKRKEIFASALEQFK